MVILIGIYVNKALYKTRNEMIILNETIVENDIFEFYQYSVVCVEEVCLQPSIVCLEEKLQSSIWCYNSLLHWRDY